MGRITYTPSGTTMIDACAFPMDLYFIKFKISLALGNSYITPSLNLPAYDIVFGCV